MTSAEQIALALAINNNAAGATAYQPIPSNQPDPAALATVDQILQPKWQQSLESAVQSIAGAIMAPRNALIGGYRPAIDPSAPGGVDPYSDMIPDALNLAGLATLGAGAAPAEADALNMGIRAYHGSPHNFDKFDMGKIGTGEGAQAYGHGLYFAENPAIAESYRNLAPPPKPTPEVREAVRALDRLGFDTTGEALSGITQHPDWMQRWDVDPTRSPQEAAAANTIQKWISENPRGHGYEVDINADPSRLLDWDKPLTKQTPSVQAAVSQAMGIPADQFHDQLFVRALSPDKTAALKNAGVPGLQYLDAGSRGAGDGTRNYVIFDDSLINILKKYGIVAPLAGGVIGSAVTGANRPFLSGGKLSQ